MKAIFTHFYILIFWFLLGIGIFIVEEASGLSGGFFGKNFVSTMFFLALAVYATVTTVVVVVVAIVKHRKQKIFSTGDLVVKHILTVTITIAVAYVVITIWESVEHGPSKDLLKIQSTELTVESTEARVSLKSLNATKSDITKVEKFSVPPSPTQPKLTPIARPSTIIQIDTNAPKVPDNECNSALMKCE